MSEGNAGPQIMVMENFHVLTRELWTKTIPSKLRDGQRAMLVVSIHAGVAPGPTVRDVNTVGIILERITTLDDGMPMVVTAPRDRSRFVIEALRGAELQGEEGKGKTHTAVFWLVELRRNDSPAASSVRRWVYRAIGRPDARISYEARAVPTRDEREAFKEHSRQLKGTSSGLR